MDRKYLNASKHGNAYKVLNGRDTLRSTTRDFEYSQTPGLSPYSRATPYARDASMHLNLGDSKTVIFPLQFG